MTSSLPSFRTSYSHHVVSNIRDYILNQDLNNNCRYDDPEKKNLKIDKHYCPFDLRGVVVGFRRFGKICFGHLLTTDGRIQFILRQQDFSSSESYKETISKVSPLGTHISIAGYAALTKTNEPSLLVLNGARDIEVIQESRAPFPDKWNGVSEEEKRRLRYQDCLVNNDKHQLFIKRAKFIKTIRRVLDDNDFLEVDTPILHKVSAGAQARPFETRANHIGNGESDSFYLRIAPETYLKRMTSAGYHKVYELGKQFRNEGIDSSHMPEFTSCEWYDAYTDCYQQIENFMTVLDELEQCLFDRNDSDHINLFRGALPTYEYRILYSEHVPNNEETLKQSVDANFKQYVRPLLQEPCFVINYPADLAPLAKRCDDDPSKVEMWQFIWKGQEIAKCYTELTDPVLQRELLEEQMVSRAGGDSEAMMLDEAFLQTMEFGMPHQAGLGFGVDRLFALFIGIDDIRDVVFFPPGM